MSTTLEVYRLVTAGRNPGLFDGRRILVGAPPAIHGSPFPLGEPPYFVLDRVLRARCEIEGSGASKIGTAPGEGCDVVG
jgi:hypothetical protein